MCVTPLVTMTCSLFRARGFGSIDRKPSAVDTSITDDSNLDLVTVRRVTRILSWFRCSVNVNVSFATFEFLYFLRLSYIMLISASFEIRASFEVIKKKMSRI